MSAVVFSGRNGLDFHELRIGALRIPEVVARVREAQKLLDALDLPRIDLFNVIAADDAVFFRNIKLKSLASAIAQVGLYDRYLKTQRRPEFMIGNSNGDSAMLVCANQSTFAELVEKSQALDTLRPSEKVVALDVVSTPLLSGISLTEYQAFVAQASTDGKTEYVTLRDGFMDLKKVIAGLHEEFGLKRFVNIGPASSLRGSDYKSIGSGELEALDSIEMDPMLSWFWNCVRPQATVLAQ